LTNLVVASVKKGLRDEKHEWEVSVKKGRDGWRELEHVEKPETRSSRGDNQQNNQHKAVTNPEKRKKDVWGR